MDEFIRPADTDNIDDTLLTKAERRERATGRLLEAARANDTEKLLLQLQQGADAAAQVNTSGWLCAWGLLPLSQDLKVDDLARAQIKDRAKT